MKKVILYLSLIIFLIGCCPEKKDKGTYNDTNPTTKIDSSRFKLTTEHLKADLPDDDFDLEFNPSEDDFGPV